MSLHGLISRFFMLPKVFGILYRSLWTGTYVRPAKYQKYGGNFQTMLSKRDPQRGFTVTEEECYTIYSSILATRELEGAIAEVGVYQGTTAKIICEVKEAKTFFLFDTFAGMPNHKISRQDDWELNTHRDTSLDSVRQYLSSYKGLIFVQGTFPESIDSANESDQIKDQVFSLVNLDVDLYQSTLDGLKFFYPRLTKGGRLISHNYNTKKSPGGNTPGVKEAFADYFEDQQHKIVEMAETQCLVIK